MNFVDLVSSKQPLPRLAVCQSLLERGPWAPAGRSELLRGPVGHCQGSGEGGLPGPGGSLQAPNPSPMQEMESSTGKVAKPA